jgi:hypothetical protein
VLSITGPATTIFGPMKLDAQANSTLVHDSRIHFCILKKNQSRDQDNKKRGPFPVRAFLDSLTMLDRLDLAYE